MIGEWLYGWVASIRRQQPPDAWDHDPYILAERERQHEQGVVDAVQVLHLREEVERRRVERNKQ